jgi:hypothetical protein
MKTLFERSHEKEVAKCITKATDTETVIEMQAAAAHYTRIRSALRRVISEINSLDTDYGFDHVEQIDGLRHMLISIAAEELVMHDTVASIYDDEELDTDEGGKDAWRGKDA